MKEKRQDSISPNLRKYSVCKSQRFLGSWNQISGRAPYITIRYQANFQIDWPKCTRKDCVGEIKDKEER